MAPTKHTTTGLLVNVAKSSAVRETSTKLGMIKKELPKKVKWLQRHWVTKGVVRGPTCKKQKTKHPSTKFHIYTAFIYGKWMYFVTHPAAILTPRRLGFIPVFTLRSNRHDCNSGIDGFDAWLHYRLHNKVVNSNAFCPVSGTQHPSIFFLLKCHRTHMCKCVILFSKLCSKNMTHKLTSHWLQIHFYLLWNSLAESES